MKYLISVAVMVCGLLAGPALAASAECEKSADDKKLSGAARSSHVKKCMEDAATKK